MANVNSELLDKPRRQYINFNKLLFSLTQLYNECPCVFLYQAKAKAKS
jgi:hypothetical protein